MDHLKLTLKLSQGEALPMKVDGNITAGDLIKMVVPHDVAVRTLALHQGRILKPGLTLRFQNVRDGDTLVLYHREGSVRPQPRAAQVPSFEMSVYRVMLEAYRIADRNQKHLENGPDRVFFELSSSSDDEGEEPEPTVIAPSPDSISEEPLPEMFGDKGAKSCEYVVPLRPYFGSIEDAGKFFINELKDEWFW